MKPNIFDLATKELSQDAFLAWLIQWADNTNKDHNENLNLCAKKFIQILVQKEYPELSIEINKVEARRQWQNIDVWAKVNDKYLIIIEDKTTTGQHSNQLSRYKDFANKWCLENKYNPPICFYIKTGNEDNSSLESVRVNGFHIFSRQDLIELFSEFPKIKNDIFIDFFQRLKRLEENNIRFENLEIGKWNGDDWQGFFQYLEKQIKKTRTVPGLNGASAGRPLI